MENWNWGIDSSENVKQKSANKLKKNEENLLRRSRSSETSKNCWVVYASREESRKPWVNCWLKFRIFRTKSEFLVRREGIFTILNQGAALWSDPRSWSTPTIPSPRTLPHCIPGSPANPWSFRVQVKLRSLDSGLPCDTQNGMRTSGNVFERLPAREGKTSNPLQKLKEFGNLFSRIETQYKATGESNEKRTETFVDTCATLPKWRWIVKSYWWDLFSQSCMIDYLKFPISELQLRKFPDSMECQSWKVNFKIEVCSKSPDPPLTMQRIQRSWDSEVNRRSCDMTV